MLVFMLVPLVLFWLSPLPIPLLLHTSRPVGRGMRMRRGWRLLSNSPPDHLVPRRLSIYTDGSCLGNRNVVNESCPSGWSMVVVEDEEVVFERNGIVVLDPTSPDYIGAEVGSNNTAELTGIYQGITWIVSRITSLPVVCEPQDQLSKYHVNVLSDSEYALKSILGVYNGPKNRSLIDTIRLQYQSLQRKIVPSGICINLPRRDGEKVITATQFSLDHVKGHSGHRWNDRADSLAVMAAHNVSMRK